MVITFYNETNDTRKIDKTLGTATGSVTGVLHERVSDVQISVKIPGTMATVVSGSNYCHVDTFGKYYYMRSYEVENDCVIINLFEDVRMSFATQIKNVVTTVDRNATEYNGYLRDKNYNSLAYEGVQYKTFPHGMDNATCILVTVG